MLAKAHNCDFRHFEHAQSGPDPLKYGIPNDNTPLRLAKVGHAENLDIMVTMC